MHYSCIDCTLLFSSFYPLKTFSFSSSFKANFSQKQKNDKQFSFLNATNSCHAPLCELVRDRESKKGRPKSVYIFFSRLQGPPILFSASFLNSQPTTTGKRRGMQRDGEFTAFIKVSRSIQTSRLQIETLTLRFASKSVSSYIGNTKKF